MKKTIIIFCLFLLIVITGKAQINEHLEIGIFQEFRPFWGNMVENPISKFHRGAEISTGISIFSRHITELGFTVGISTNSTKYSDPDVLFSPLVTETSNTVVFVRGQFMFFPASLFERKKPEQRIDPYLITEFGPDIEYFSKTVTTGYPKNKSDSTFSLRSPSINKGFGIGTRVFFNTLQDKPKIAIDFRVLYIVSGSTHYGVLDRSLGYFPVNEGRKEYLL
jgi:hypothetical protein